MGYVQECLVDRQGLYLVGVSLEDGMYLGRYLGIVVVARGHYDEPGAQALGHQYRLGRVYTVAAGLVAGRADHAALAVEPHGDGLAAERGIVALLDRCKESIHVYMYYLALHWPNKVTIFTPHHGHNGQKDDGSTRRKCARSLAKLDNLRNFVPSECH